MSIGNKSASTQEHRAQSPDCVRCCIITVSDTRTLDTDRGGALIEELLQGAGHEVLSRQIVTDTQAEIENVVREILQSDASEAIIVTGGSGIGPRDVLAAAEL
jgi:molybdopterin adenylyltransferase